MVLAAQGAGANDLKQFYELALTRDSTLQAAHFLRDALVEAHPPGHRAVVHAALCKRFRRAGKGRIRFQGPRSATRRPIVRSVPPCTHSVATVRRIRWGLNPAQAFLRAVASNRHQRAQCA